MSDRPAARTFYFGLDLSAGLTVDEIWPDGDGPDNPTVDDVIARVRASSLGLSDFIDRWNMAGAARLTVDGQEALP